MNFESFDLDPRIMSGVRAQGYVTPTPIQERSIPVIVKGGDVMGLAQTGTGKTAAFVLPILQRLLKGRKNELRALVIAPTRELAEQINDVFCVLGHDTGLRSHTVYGGVGMEPQIQRFRRGYEIAVACPGRLLDHIQQGTVRLGSLEVLVLDEADQMFDMGFFPTIRKILRHLPEKRQSLFFSATMPDDIKHLANEVLFEPEVVQVNFRRPAETVTHAIYPVDPASKTDLLFELLAETGEGSVLVFTRTKHRAKRLARQLESAGHSVTSLQGNLSQNKRLAALSGFRDGRYRIMVATDIAARGIDVSQVSHVINYDIPDTVEAYTHRIGRTGRAAKTGDAFTLVTSEDEAMVRSIERALGKRIERKIREGIPQSPFSLATDENAPERQRSSGRSGRSRNGERRGSGQQRPQSQSPRREQRSGDGQPRAAASAERPRSGQGEGRGAPRPEGQARRRRRGGNPRRAGAQTGQQQTLARASTRAGDRSFRPRRGDPR